MFVSISNKEEEKWVNRMENLSSVLKRKKKKKNMKELSFTTQFKIEFLLLFTSCRKLLEEMPEYLIVGFLSSIWVFIFRMSLPKNKVPLMACVCNISLLKCLVHEKIKVVCSSLMNIFGSHNSMICY